MNELFLVPLVLIGLPLMAYLLISYGISCLIDRRFFRGTVSIIPGVLVAALILFMWLPPSFAASGETDQHKSHFEECRKDGNDHE